MAAMAEMALIAPIARGRAFPVPGCGKPLCAAA